MTATGPGIDWKRVDGKAFSGRRASILSFWTLSSLSMWTTTQSRETLPLSTSLRPVHLRPVGMNGFVHPQLQATFIVNRSHENRFGAFPAPFQACTG